MKMPLIVQGQPSPLANAFSQIGSAIANGPSAEQRALFSAESDLNRLKVDEMIRQANAVKGAGSRLSDIFGEHLAGIDATPQTMVGPAPQEGYTMEDPADQTMRRTTGLASLFADVGKEGAAAIKEGLATGQAFGTPDEMRRSMVLGGHSIDPNFAPTAAEGNRIMTRKTDDSIREAAAKPMTESEFKAKQLQQNWDHLDQLSPQQQLATGVAPKKGMSLTTDADGNVSFSTGGDATGMDKPITKDYQKSLQANQELKSYVTALRDLVKTNPSGVGPTGNVQRIAQNAADVMQVATKMFGSPEGVNKALATAAVDAQAHGLSLNFNPSLPLITRIHNLMIYKAADALAGQSGRSVTDADLKRIVGTVGDPSSWTEGPQAYTSGLDFLDNMADINIQRSSEMLKAGNVNPVMPGGNATAGALPINTTPGAPAAAPAGAAQPISPQQAVDLVSKARAAIGSGKNRAMVLQRLQEMGIQPPGDL